MQIFGATASTVASVKERQKPQFRYACNKLKFVPSHGLLSSRSLNRNLMNKPPTTRKWSIGGCRNATFGAMASTVASVREKQNRSVDRLVTSHHARPIISNLMSRRSYSLTGSP